MHFAKCCFVFQVAFESELRFGCRLDETEQELKKVPSDRVKKKKKTFYEPPFVAIEACLRPRLAKHARILLR